MDIAKSTTRGRIAAGRHAACPGAVMGTRHGRPATRAPRRGRTLALALSIALHAAVLAALGVHLGGDARVKSVPAMLVRLVLPPGRLVPAPEGDGPLPPRTVASAGQRVHPTGCRGTVYTGIGATVNSAGFIVELAPGGPAERAGVRPGDAILNLADLPIDAYPAGQPVALRLLRDGAEAATVVLIGAICDEPEGPVA